MFAQLTNSPYFLAGLVFIFLGLILSITGFTALMQAKISSFTLRTTLGFLLLLFGSLSGMVALGIQGYQALTKESVAARISVSPVAPKRFAAIIRYPNGRTENFMIAGDEIYIDAHILKWQPLANMFGLHTAYELDRIGGRYREIEEERSAPRTLHALSHEKPVNLFGLRQRYAILSILLDAKYGSATFVPITQSAELELRVSTTGLLIREVTAPSESH